MHSVQTPEKCVRETMQHFCSKKCKLYLSHLTACDCSMLVPLKSQHAESSLIFYRLFCNASKNLTCLVNWLLGRHDVTLPRGLKIPGFERPLTIASESPWDAIVWFLGEVNFHQEKHAKNIKQQHHNPYMHPNWEQLSLIQTNRHYFKPQSFHDFLAQWQSYNPDCHPRICQYALMSV